MKQFCLLIFASVCFSCSNKEPYAVPLTPLQVWIEQNSSDTIITGEGYIIPAYIYYAQKNWQASADTSLTHGFRDIAIRYGDSILVKPLNDLSSSYDGPFFFHLDQDNISLKAQNFLITGSANDIRIFIPLH